MRRGLRFGVVLIAAAPAVVVVACATAYSDATPPFEDGGADSARDDAATSDQRTDATEAGASDAGFTPTTLVRVYSIYGPRFDIEATEVTVAQYMLFAAHAAQPLGFPQDKCPNKTALGPPDGHCGSRFADDDPVTCVDWCDADAYCKAIGRHLCGDVSGGSLAETSRNDPGTDAWYYACRGANGKAYPYGPDAMTGYCATDDDTADQPVSVGSFALCQGAETGLFDMAGNAAEWVDSCSSAGCLLRGGSYESALVDTSCDAVSDTGHPQNAYPYVGFRCCAED